MGKKIFSYFLLILVAIGMIIPFLWMISTAIKSPQEYLEHPFRFIPKSFILSNFSEAWNKVPFDRYFINSIIVTIFTTISILITASLGAFCFSWFEFKGKDLIFYTLLALVMVPMAVYIIPSYIIIQKLGWIDTFYALIVPWTVNIFNIFLLRQHFKSIPKDLIEASILDGCNPLEILYYVLIPMSKPILVTITIFSIISGWNNFMWPLIVTNSDKMRVIQVGLSYFAQSENTEWTLLMAASTFTILPIIIIYFFAQRKIMENYTRSGIKG